MRNLTNLGEELEISISNTVLYNITPTSLVQNDNSNPPRNYSRAQEFEACTNCPDNSDNSTFNDRGDPSLTLIRNRWVNM